MSASGFRPLGNQSPLGSDSREPDDAERLETQAVGSSETSAEESVPSGSTICPSKVTWTGTEAGTSVGPAVCPLVDGGTSGGDVADVGSAAGDSACCGASEDDAAEAGSAAGGSACCGTSEGDVADAGAPAGEPVCLSGTFVPTLLFCVRGRSVCRQPLTKMAERQQSGPRKGVFGPSESPEVAGSTCCATKATTVLSQ